MPQPKEVHCPFCHHVEMHDGPVGSTVRCRNCKSIFRLPAEGMKHGEKVKKYKVYRHSPLYYIILVLLLCGIGLGGFEVRQFFIERQKRLQEIYAKVEVDPFLPKVHYKLDDPRGVLERFMECWKQGNTRTPETANYSGFECMLLYVSPEEIPDAKKLQDVVDGFKKRYADYQIQSYSVPDQGTGDPRNPTEYELKVTLIARSAGGAVSAHGQFTAELKLSKNEFISRGNYVREHQGEPPADGPAIEAKETWGILVTKSEVEWTD